jgi:hypothetical protein
VLIVSGAARHDQTCPGEMSKTFVWPHLPAKKSSARASSATFSI